MIRSKPRSAQERRWLRVLGTLNEFQARRFLACLALDQGRGGISRISELGCTQRKDSEQKGRGSLEEELGLRGGHAAGEPQETGH